MNSTALKEKFFNLVPKGALILSCLTFAGYVLGFLRDRIFARTFGLSAEFDALNAASILPELVIDIFVAGALGAAFIPIFSDFELKDAARSRTFANSVITASVLTMIVCSVFLIIFAPTTVHVIAPGFNQATAHVYTNLLRILSLSPIIFAAAIAVGEILVAKRQFVFYGLAPLLYNFGIIAGTLLFHQKFGIFSAAIGTILGALLYLCIRMIGVLKIGFLPKPRFAFTTTEFKKLLALMAPRMLGQPIESLTFLFFTAVASGISTGAVSAVNFGRNFQSVPVALIGIAFSIAAFPALAEYFSKSDKSGFLSTFKKSLIAIGIFSSLAAVATYFLGPFIITLFFSGGVFGPEEIKKTSLVLIFFTFSIPLESLSHILARAFYATKNTIVPTIASLLALGVTILIGQASAHTIGIIAIPLAFAAGMALKITILGIVLPVRIKNMRSPTNS